MPIVTISRQLGSGGDEVAAALAAQLNATLLDRAALLAVVQRYWTATASPSPPEIEERAPGFWQRFAEERHRYEALLRAAVYSAALTEAAVIVGHGAEVLLRDVTHALRVKVVAPVDRRAQRLVERERPAPTPAAAAALVRQSDRDRTAYLRYFFHANWLDLTLYDTVINTEKLAIETVVTQLVEAARAAELAPTAVSLARLRDLALGSEVAARLAIDPRVAAAAIRVSARAGAVVLQGHVATAEERDAAEAIARAVTGVRQVQVELDVSVPTVYDA
jgi:cytidylate kinase